MVFRTGKQQAVFHSNDLLAKHFYADLAPAAIPDHVDYSTKMGPIGVLDNDRCGCCSIATSLHAVQLWTSSVNSEIVPDDESCLADYQALTGYNPATGANDTGCVLLQKNQYWMNVGFAINADGSLDRLDGFAQIEPGDLITLRQTAALFGCAELGLLLPDDAQSYFSRGGTWSDTSMPPNPNSGHDVLVVAYQPGWFVIATWTGLIAASDAWVSKYMDEGNALLRRLWCGQTGTAPSGLTMPQLDTWITRAQGVLSYSAH